MRDGRLHIKFDRPLRKDVLRVAAQTQLLISNFVTGQSNSIIDGETSNGRLMQESSNQFTVVWYDPFAKRDSETQAWMRVK